MKWVSPDANSKILGRCQSSDSFQLNGVQLDEHHFGFDRDIADRINNLRWTSGTKEKIGTERFLYSRSSLQLLATEKILPRWRKGRLLGGTTITEDSSSSTRVIQTRWFRSFLWDVEVLISAFSLATFSPSISASLVKCSRIHFLDVHWLVSVFVNHSFTFFVPSSTYSIR